jgi:hypothetical protein
MDHDSGAAKPSGETLDSYEPPAVTDLGTLAELTRQEKTVGGADGSTFLGLDIGSVPV